MVRLLRLARRHLLGDFSAGVGSDLHDNCTIRALIFKNRTKNPTKKEGWQHSQDPWPETVRVSHVQDIVKPQIELR